MKGNEKNILIGSVVIAILIVAAAWKFFYSSDIEEAEKVQKDIDSLKVRMDELNAKSANRAMYESGIANSSDIIDTVLSIYGPGNTPEKTIMLIVDLCKKTGSSIMNISFEGNQLLYSSESSEDGKNPDIRIYKSGMSINITSGYTQMKKIMDYINSHPERMNVENFSTSYNSTDGMLSTSMKVNLYSVTDKNHVYEAPVIEDIELGTENIFKATQKVEEPVEEGLEGVEGVNSNSEVVNSAVTE